jgi:hypothetical protein
MACAVTGMGQLFMPLMIEELVVMRSGSQELQQKREILKITMRNRCIDSSTAHANATIFRRVLRP